MKKLLLFVTLSIFTIAAKAQMPTAGAKFNFAKTTYDFGTVPQGPDIVYEFAFTNTGSAPLVIYEASGSCSCTIPSFDRAPVKPGASAKIKVKFETKDKQGTFNKTVYIKSNATARNEPFEIFIKGNVATKGSKAKSAAKKK